jgi:adenylyltransferase/sulfurtransferase
MFNLQNEAILKNIRQTKENLDQSIEASQEAFFDRQKRITWWDQKRLAQARVLVIGAGALGNEVLKNLALLGVGNILVADFDTIEDSNLSRTVLFRTSDAVDGARKADVAASRAKSLNPNPNAIVKPIHGNIVWELGMGVYRYVDLVIGCLDNLEARLHVNLNCWRTSTPWIDGGMWELSGNVAVYDSTNEKACYECGMTPDHYRQAKIRYSCTNETVKTKIKEGHEPTTQTTSAIIAAIQSQETVKLLHGMSSFPGRRLIFNGAPHFYHDHDYAPMTTTELTLNHSCLCHNEDRIDKLVELESASAHITTARELLEMVNYATGWKESSLELGRLFAIEAICPHCLQTIKLNRPLFKVHDVDVVCRSCEIRCPTCGAISIGEPDCPNCGQEDISEPHISTIDTLNSYSFELRQYLDYTLTNLGIPPLHIVRVHNQSNDFVYVELSGDEKQLWNIT